MSTGHIRFVEHALQELIKDWERFFAGIRKTPPQTERDELSRRLRRLAEGRQQSRRHADRFRIEQLQHRFMSYSILWERLLREREEGRGRSAALLRATAGAPQQLAAATGGVGPNATTAASVHEGGAQVSVLYELYAEAKQRVGQPVGVDAATFAAQVAEQRDQLEQRFGHAVRFEVVVEGDKVKLAARKDFARPGGE